MLTDQSAVILFSLWVRSSESVVVGWQTCDTGVARPSSPVLSEVGLAVPDVHIQSESAVTKLVIDPNHTSFPFGVQFFFSGGRCSFRVPSHSFR